MLLSGIHRVVFESILILALGFHYIIQNMIVISELEKAKDAQKAKEEAERAKEIAQEANRAKSEFLANMSHEIRTLINAVLGMDEMILRESIDSKISEYASDVRILVVDDNEMNLKGFLGLLKKHGMQIDTAMSGKECLARMEKI